MIRAGGDNGGDTFEGAPVPHESGVAPEQPSHDHPDRHDRRPPEDKGRQYARSIRRMKAERFGSRSNDMPGQKNQMRVDTKQQQCADQHHRQCRREQQDSIGDI